MLLLHAMTHAAFWMLSFAGNLLQLMTYWILDCTYMLWLFSGDIAPAISRALWLSRRR